MLINTAAILKNINQTEFLIITLAETTPVYEATRLESDLKRDGINSKW
jgi:arsenite-transporting ATPase